MKMITRTINLLKLVCLVYNTETKQNEQLILFVEKTRNTEKRAAQLVKERNPTLRLVLVESTEEINKKLSLPLDKFIEIATEWSTAIEDEEPSDNH